MDTTIDHASTSIGALVGRDLGMDIDGGRRAVCVRRAEIADGCEVGASSMRGPSQTAMLTAVARALHREKPPPWVLDDHLALGFVGAAGPGLRARLLSEMRREDLLAFSRFVCVRARFPEDIAEDGVAGGVRQYVILGAGLDPVANPTPDHPTE